jgi:hypothetical protein
MLYINIFDVDPMYLFPSSASILARLSAAGPGRLWSHEGLEYIEKKGNEKDWTGSKKEEAKSQHTPQITIYKRMTICQLTSMLTLCIRRRRIHRGQLSCHHLVSVKMVVWRGFNVRRR